MEGKVQAGEEDLLLVMVEGWVERVHGGKFDGMNLAERLGGSDNAKTKVEGVCGSGGWVGFW